MKHAYLIIAHNDFEILKKLVSLLDNEHNDIYIHFDAKVATFAVIATPIAVKVHNAFFILNFIFTIIPFYTKGTKLKSEKNCSDCHFAASGAAGVLRKQSGGLFLT